MKLLLLICNLLIVLMNAIAFNDNLAEETLRNKLLQNYDKRVRPVAYINQTTYVSVMIFPHTIIELNKETEKLMVNGYEIMFWRDEHLSWNPIEHENLTTFDVTIDQIWIPDIVLFYNTGRNEKDEPTLVHVYYSGTVRVVKNIVAEVPCETNYKYYPFDTHSCIFEFGSWTHGSNAIHLRVNPGFNYLNKKEFTRQTKWDVVGYSQDTEVYYFDEMDQPSYHTVKYTFLIKRRASIYSLIWTLPIVASFLVTLACFWLELGSIPRLAVGLANFWMVVVNLLSLVIKLPGGNEIPLLARFLATCCGMAGIFILETVILSSASKKQDNPPEFLLNIASFVPDFMLCAVNDANTSSTNVNEAEAPQKPSSEWRRTSKIFDRIFFHCFTIIYVVVTICLVCL